MKGFIEVTAKNGSYKELIAVGLICRVIEEEDGTACIITVECKKVIYGFCTVEKYSEVITKINEAVQ